MRPLFINSELKTPLNLHRELNSQNGNDSEIISASNLIQALNAEVSWGSRNEDNSKLDLLLSFNHPWILGQRVLLFSQVKSGSSFGKISNNNSIKLFAKGIKQAQTSQNNICLIWYDHNTKENYWMFVHPNTNSKATVLGRNHLLTPATKFEIIRCISRIGKQNYFNARGLTIDVLTFEKVPISDYRKSIKKIYTKFGSIINPLYGKVNITNYGWKHMFRKSRKLTHKNDSLIILPYLKQLLTFQPDRHWIISFITHKHGDFTVLKYEHILRYEKIKNNKDANMYEIVIKLVEETVFPTNWKKENLLSQKVFRKVVLKSTSLKKKKA
ncbi:hypothetical protein [Sphingobacterium sp.]|uniref:hypothetical protein n=1 Tax=Sphingobacterium sp. TaxID=341027 RepID=UPI00289EF043|nr:hypothetical protein [Sphingobacterium sp.]